MASIGGYIILQASLYLCDQTGEAGLNSRKTLYNKMH